jgi:RNA polymerase sigma-70 factor (ECF subfamily)
MKSSETEIGGQDRQFPTTAWGNVTRLSDLDPGERDRVLRSLIDRYWKPVYCRIRYSWAKDNEDAKDLTQDFFLHVLLEGALLEKFSSERGSFRAFLKAALTNFMCNVGRNQGRQKRGGDVQVLRMGELDPELTQLVSDTRTSDPDEIFNLAWKSVVWARVLDLMAERLRAEGKAVLFEVFRHYVLEPPDDSVSYQSVGNLLGLSTDTVKNHLTRARREFLRAATDVLGEYVESPEDLAVEMKELFGA